MSKILSKLSTVVLSAVVLLAVSAVSALAEEQQAAVPSSVASFVGKTCYGKYEITGERHNGATGTIDIRIASVENNQITGEVRAKPSKLPRHGFAGAVDGNTAATVTDYGSMTFVFSNDTLSGSAEVDPEKPATKALGHGHVELDFKLSNCS